MYYGGSLEVTVIVPRSVEIINEKYNILSKN